MPTSSAPILARVRAVVRGRVQGVSYRASTAERARALGLSGWVRNRDDGAVELEAEGPADAVAALIDWCKVGPPAARVSDVAVDALPPPSEAPRARFRVAYE